MTRGRLFVSLLAASASFTFALPAAHAGGGMGAGSGITTCRLIASGATNQGQTIAITDAFTTNDLQSGPAGDVVKVNSAVLLCDFPASGVTISGTPTGSPVDTSLVTTSTCYSVSGTQSAKRDVTIEDPFTEVAPPSGAPATVSLGAIAFVCVPSIAAPAP